MIIQPTAFRLLRGRRVHDALVRSSRPGIDHSVPLKESSSEREGEVQGTSVIIVGFTDNKYLALKPASCEARHEVEDSLGVWEREEGLRSLPTHNPFVVGQRLIKTTTVKSQGMCTRRSLIPSQMSMVAIGVQTTLLSH